MEKSQYLKIKLSSLHPSVPLTFNIYVFIHNHYTLYLKAGDKIDAGKIQALIARSQGDFFFVHQSEWKAYKAFIHEIISSAAIAPVEKAQVLRESSLALVEELFEHPDVNVALNNSKPVISEFIEFMRSAPEAMGHLIGLSGHDFYTYNHSLDVSIYSLGLGQILGLKDKELEELGVGALFHDIGKRNISLDILCKKGSLTQDEWTIMQQHTHFGLVILNENPDISDAMKAICFEHHESYVGNGYPQQLSGQDIHPYARIVAICDTYDAMTTQRSYNTPLKPFDALRMMKDQMATKFDPNMLKAMYSVLFQLKTNAS